MKKWIFLFLTMSVAVSWSSNWQELLGSLREQQQIIVASLNSIEAELTITRASLKAQMNDNDLMQGELDGLKKTLKEREAALERHRKLLTEQKSQLERQEKLLVESERLLPALRKNLTDLQKSVEVDKIVLKVTIGVTSAGLVGAGFYMFAKGDPVLGIIGLALGVLGGVIDACVD
jgi:multidrug efflux pump subunit AcrA (membrane-fusion protein)